MSRHAPLGAQRFGRLTVLALAPGKRGKRLLWHCRCDCGGETITTRTDLISGNVASCGCLRREQSRRVHRTHGLSKTREYRIWAGMNNRCANKNNQAFHWYGARGIVVCERWRTSFPAFLDDMGRAPSDTYTIERIDNDGPYAPENCRWATRTEQGLNTRRNRVITFHGRSLTLSQWDIACGFKKGTIQMRLARGWSIVAALVKPLTPLRGPRS